MCDHYVPCLSPQDQAYRELTLLLLDCWQREYDQRPYRNFQFKRLEFEERMLRKFNYTNDFKVIVEFLENRILCSMQLVGIDIIWHEFKLLRRFVCSLKNVRYIKLHMMSLPRNFFEELIKYASCFQCTDLSLEGSQLSNENIRLLHKFLLNSNYLQDLNMASCNINQFDFALIADGVHKCPTMKRVNFTRLIGQSLHLDTMKIAHVMSQLIWQKKLTKIVMQHCEFLPHDMEIIAEYIANPCSVLQTLDVAYNRIGPDGVVFLLRAASKNTQFKHLNVSSNGLGEHGGEHVAHYLSSVYALETLDLTYNRISASAINLILTTMKKSLKVIRLKIWGNSFDGKTGRVLRRLLAARVVLQDWIDVTVTFDDTLGYYRIIPYY